MRRFVVHIAGFIVTVFLLLNVVSYLSLYFLRQSHFYKPQFVVHVVEEESFDYAVLGSSTGLTTLNTTQIDNGTGLNGFNISVDDTSLNSHYLMLQHFIASGGKVNQLILVISPGDLANDDPQLSGNDYRFLPYIHKSYTQTYFKGFDSRQASILRASQYAPFVGVSYFNTELFYPSLKSAISPATRNRFDKRGNYVYPNQGKMLTKGPSQKEVGLSISNPYFKKIKTLCLEQSIELIIYQPPIYDRIITGDIDSLQFINHSNLLIDPSFFYDRIHVNGKGRKVASSEFAKRLKSL